MSHIPQTQRSKPAYVSRVRAAKATLTACKKQSRDLYHSATRAELLQRNDQWSTAEPDERTRLLAGHQTLEEGSARLEDSTRVALRTEEVGAEILRNLRGQREQIVHASDTVSASGLCMIGARLMQPRVASYSGHQHRSLVRDYEEDDSAVRSSGFG